MKRLFNVINDAQIGLVRGLVVQTDLGTLIAANPDTQNIQRSTDNGLSWETVYTIPNNTSPIGLFLDSNGNVFFTTRMALPPFDEYGLIVRSTNDGKTFSLVLTGESSAFWNIAEDPDGNLFAGEYSAGNQDENELYGTNIWKSTDSGENWSKWFSGTPNTAPTYRQGLRHIHAVNITSDGKIIAGFGDGMDWAESGTFLLNSDGTINKKIAHVRTGNGWIGFAEAENGDLFFGGDTSPTIMYRYDADNNIVYEAVDLVDSFSENHDQYLADAAVGKDGVLYFLTNGSVSSGDKSFLIASGDNGQTWVSLEYQEDVKIAQTVFVNTTIEGSRVYIGRKNAEYVSIPDYTKAEIVAMYSSGGYHTDESTLSIVGN